MKVIIVSKRLGGSRTFKLGGLSGAFITVCLACLLGVPVATYLAWLKSGSIKDADFVSSDVVEAWVANITEQGEQLDRMRQQESDRTVAMTLRLAELQARLVRLDALGERLTTMADLEKGEFDFGQTPAMGGPELLAGNELDEIFAAPNVATAVDELAAQIEDRQQQLETLEALMANRKLEREVFIAGRPVNKGWMSSRFGRRTDPFTGRVAWHSGVDFAGKEGADIVAVAAGVVTWSDDRYGYGNLVEINHGNGFVTRYAHCKENLVKVGDVVKKGQIIALMGSSGRSTGPHVHFEVYKHGRAVDPSSYIHRASR